MPGCDEAVVVVGVLRSRRSLGRNLLFFVLEPAEPESRPVQLVLRPEAWHDADFSFASCAALLRPMCLVAIRGDLEDLGADQNFQMSLVAQSCRIIKQDPSADSVGRVLEFSFLGHLSEELAAAALQLKPTEFALLLQQFSYAQTSPSKQSKYDLRQAILRRARGLAGLPDVSPPPRARKQHIPAKTLELLKNAEEVYTMWEIHEDTPCTEG
jgi:hypothetical protein